MIPSLASLNPTLAAPPHVHVPQPDQSGGDTKLRKTFDEFVGRTFYGQLISSMRQTVGPPAYLHGGRAEEIFRSQMDQTLAEDMTKRTAHEFTGPMFELFQLSRS